MWLNGISSDARGNRFVSSRIVPPLRIRWEMPCRDDPIASDGKRIVLKTPWELVGRSLQDGTHLWTFKGKRREIDGSSISATTEAIFIHSKGRIRSLGWDGQVRWESRTPKKFEEPGASCIAHDRHWGVRNLLVDTRDGNVLHDFTQPGLIMGFVGFTGDLVWYRASTYCILGPQPESEFEIIGLDLTSYSHAIRIGLRARTFTDPIFTSNYVICKVYEADGHEGIWVWSAVDARSLCRISIPANEFFCAHGDRAFCFVRPDSRRDESRLECYDLESGAQVWVNDVMAIGGFPILTDGHVWFTHEDRVNKRSILVAVDSVTGKTVWQKPFSSYCSLMAATGDCLILSSRGKVYCLESAVSSGASVRSAQSISTAPEVPQVSLGRIKKARGCARPKQTGAYELTDYGTLLLEPARKPKTITYKPNGGSDVVLAKGLGAGVCYQSAFDAIEAEGAATIGLKVPDGARLILLRKGSQQTIEIDELTCIEVLLNAQGTHVACALITTDGEVGEATLRVYAMDTGKVVHEVALEPESLLAMNLRWVDDCRIAFRNEEAGDEEEWYVWNLATGGVDAVE